jgi:hypothetical protein
MKKLLLILLCLPMVGFGQNVYIPDANFKAYLVNNRAINTSADTEIQLSEANSFNGNINCSSYNISDLTGIEDFIALTSLQCWDNNITNIDLSNCTNLVVLSSGNNNLTNLNLSNCSSLISITLGSNNLTNLDLRNGNNNIIDTLRIENNPNLYCINVDDSTWSVSNWSAPNIGQEYVWDSQSYFSNNCPPATTIQEFITNKELLKVTDLLGRETKGTKNELLLYIYDDGTVEKRITID